MFSNFSSGLSAFKPNLEEFSTHRDLSPRRSYKDTDFQQDFQQDFQPSLLRNEFEDRGMELRKDLEQNFRPVFQQFVYGGERIALHDLRRLLENRWYRRMLPPDKVHDLLDLADFNPGRALSYDEFVAVVLGRHTSLVLKSSIAGSSAPSSSNKKRRQRSEGFLFQVCRNTIPPIELGEYMFKYKCCPPAFFMIVLSLTQIILFSVCVVNNNSSSSPVWGACDIINSTLAYKPTRRYEAWRFITYTFSHQDYMHFAFTLLFQLFFGIPLEIVFGFWRLMIVYICGVITGSLLQSVSDHYVGMVGGSGGIYAIITAHCITFIYNWKALKTNITESSAKRLLCSISVRVVIILIFALSDIGLAVYRRFYLTDSNKIGLGGHAGGIIAGLCLARPFLRDIKRYPWQQNSGWMALFSFLALVGGAVVFNVAYNGYPATDWS